MSAETEAIFQDLPDTLGLMQSCQEVYVDSGTSASYSLNIPKVFGSLSRIPAEQG